MKMKSSLRSLKSVACVLSLLTIVAVSPSFVYSQTATSGAIVGVVSDPSNAVVKGAAVALTETGRNATQRATSDAAGRFAFPAVDPGEYTLRVEAKGFRTSVTKMLSVEVNKSSNVDVKLEVGATGEVVEVTASTMTELQTQDSSVGEVLSGTELNRLPVAGRSAAQLIFYQPGVAPDMGHQNGASADGQGGQIAGARSEQITFTIDGGDATSDLEGSNNYNSPSQDSGAVSPVVPVPQDSIEEFRVATNNANSTFGESSGGQVSMLTKSGTNSIHGSLYEYHGDNGLNANGWTNDHNGVAKPPAVDNRFGLGVGGPIIKDKLFYYAFYEGRRFHDQNIIDRIVPTTSLKNGILQFADASGTVDSYNLNPANGSLAANCGPGGNTACDPRGLGISSVVMAQMALLPTGNNTGEGDGLNTIGLTVPVATPISTNVGKLKLNYSFNSKWSAFASWQYSSTSRTGTEQISLLGAKPASVSGDPYFANFYTLQVQGQISPTFLSVTHGSFLKNWWGWTRVAPSPLVSGTAQALQIAGEDQGEEADFSGSGKLFADPININTQQARSRVWDGHDWYIGQDFTKIVRNHQFQFGGDGRIWYDYHVRTDQVLGGLTTAPITYVGSSNLAQDSFATISGAYQPMPCSASVTTNCLPGADTSFWNGYYASILGIVDHSAQVETRNGSFVANPLGTPTLAHYTVPSFNAYLQDVWKARRNLTITAGVNWGVTLPPTEAGGLESTLVYADSNTPVNVQQFLKTRGAALEAGNSYNPLLGVSPVNSLAAPFSGKMRLGSWKDIGPRFAVAWQVKPSTVIRGGYSLVFDRTSAVTSVLNGLLAGGLADVDTCGGPIFSGGAAVCSGTTTNPTTAFRIGPDGSSVPVPAPVNNSIPLVPVGSSLSRSFGADPYLTPGHAHAIDFTVQRALPQNLFLEVGYIGRFSRNLSQNQQLNSADYRQKDPGSGQTYGQAFDALDRAFIQGTALSPQPFLENLMATTGPNAVCTPGTCTGLAFLLMPSVAAGDLGFFDYLMNLPGVFGPAGAFATPTSNNQIFENAQVTDGGYSDYNGGIVTLRKAMSHGLQFQFNYTWSHAIGNQGTNQQYVYSSNSPYNLAVDKSSETFDHRHTVTAFWYYELPFGKGRSFSTSNGLLDRIIGGWSTSGIFNFFTGAPLCVIDDSGNYGSFFPNDCAVLSGGIPDVTSGATTASSIPRWGVHKQPNGSLNAFADPTAVYNSLQFPLLSTQGQIPRDQMHQFAYWNVDFSIGKKIPLTERVGLVLTADAFNLLNHTTFTLSPSALDLLNPAGFGAITTQFTPGISNTGARQLQLGLRVEF